MSYNNNMNMNITTEYYSCETIWSITNIIWVLSTNILDKIIKHESYKHEAYIHNEQLVSLVIVNLEV